MASRAFFRRLLRVVLTIASLHSLVLGFFLGMYTNLFLEFMGFPPRTDIFYPQQSGAFLFILGVGYGIAASDPDRHQGLVVLAIISKGLAVLFLFYHVLVLNAPGQILLAGIYDSLFLLLLSFFAWMSYRH